MAFTHLHVHTGYSLLDGAGKIPEMVKRAKALGQDSMAITDHGVMYGAVEFFVECIKQGVKPIIGCEIYMTENNILDRVNTETRYHLILLCKDKEGYHNLVKMVSRSFIDGYYYKPRVDYETLAKYSKGLICMSACLQGEVAYNLLRDNYSEAKKVARRLQDIFGKDDFYVEIQNHGLRDELRIHTDLIKLAREIDAKLIATNDVHYTLKEDEEAHDCLLCLQTGHKVSNDNRMKYDGGQYYIKSEEEMRDGFKFCTEAIDNTIEVVKKCNVHMDFTRASYGDITSKVKKAIEEGKVPKEKESLIELVDKCEYNVPKFKVPEGYDNVSYLKKLVMDGLNKRFTNPSKDLIDRVEFELKTIIDMGFVDYFLLVWDYIHYAKTHDIPVGPGRGSGVGSLVAYALEITDTNPIEYKLFFERFLNPERVSMPDIDTDFEVEKRQDVINYVREKYNVENVAQIVTFGT
ncbi:MAG: DNA polymerase III subunit alpha, partial [Lachnospiraceae bacterium]|nr:DNA polymerase III subunit alpha [Lachnospiraceae bacterium]